MVLLLPYEGRQCEKIHNQTAMSRSTAETRRGARLKSESRTSLLKSSSVSSRSTYFPERTTGTDRSHHHRPAAIQVSSKVAEESFLSAECDVSARRPLWHPSLLRNVTQNRDTTRASKSQPHASNGQIPAANFQDDPSEQHGLGRGVRKHCKSSNPTDTTGKRPGTTHRLQTTTATLNLPTWTPEYSPTLIAEMTPRYFLSRGTIQGQVRPLAGMPACLPQLSHRLSPCPADPLTAPEGPVRHPLNPTSICAQFSARFLGR